MFTFTVILQIFITAILGYLAINSYFRFHVSMYAADAAFFSIWTVVMIAYLDTTRVFEFLLATALLGVLYLILRAIMVKKQWHAYILFNICGRQFQGMREDIEKHLEDAKIEPHLVCYKRRRPYLVVVRDTPLKNTSELFKAVDKDRLKHRREFTMYNYWYLIVFIILMVILWRF